MAEVGINERHDQQPTSSAASIFSESIIFQILLLLPLKDVTQCKCVCKSWYALLTDPYFLSLYSHRRIIILSYPTPSQFRFLSMDFEGLDGQIIENLEFPTQDISVSRNHLPYKLDYHEEFDVQIVGSCNGLMLCRLQNGEHLFLWNPTTRECMKLPHYEGYSQENIYLFYGLGVDSSSNGYKVVRGFSTLYRRIEGIQIYSRKTNSWKTIQDFPYPGWQETGGAFVNGFLHWLARADNGGCAIVSLDLIEEKFSYVPLPDNYGDNNFIIHFGALEGLLCIVCNSFYGPTGVWTIWVMKEYGVKESWTKLMQIPCMVRTIGMRPLCFTKNGEVMMKVAGKKFVKYDPKTKKFTTLLEITSGLIESTTVIKESLDPSHC